MCKHFKKDNQFSKEKVQFLFRDKNSLCLKKDLNTLIASCIFEASFLSSLFNFPLSFTEVSYMRASILNKFSINFFKKWSRFLASVSDNFFFGTKPWF